MSESECKISQYADDTTLFLDGRKTTFQACLETLDRFSKISGLKISNSKTEILWIGALKVKKIYFFQKEN